MHVGDTIFIFCLALIIFGPKKLPEIGRQIGKLMVEFRRASNEFKMQIEDELRASEEAERQKEITAATTMLPSSEPATALTAEASDPANSTAAADSVPVIAPPVTGLPVNHTFASPDVAANPGEGSVYQAQIPQEPEETFSEPEGEFNAGLNAASNGVIAELPEGAPEFSLEETATEAGKAQAPVHHG